MTMRATATGAVVRKPLGTETAGGGRQWCRMRYGELSAADDVRGGNGHR